MEFFDFGVHIGDSFEYGDYNCTIPKLLAFAYSLAICNSGSASGIKLAGFDGFDNLRTECKKANKEIIDLVETYQEFEHIPLTSLTETPFPIKEQSIYSLI